MVHTQALTKIWQIKLHLQQKSHQIQIKNQEEPASGPDIGPDKDMANQISFIPNRSSFSSSRIKLNQLNDLDRKSDKGMANQFFFNLKGHQIKIRE